MLARFQKGILKNLDLEALGLSSYYLGMGSSEAYINFLRNRLRAKTLQSTDPSSLQG